MKNIFKIIVCAFFVFSFNSCEDSDLAVDKVTDGTTSGAVLRTVNVISSSLNRSDDSSFFSVEVEEQDEQNGALLESVDIYVSIRDLTPDNGTTTAEALVKTIPCPSGSSMIGWLSSSRASEC